MIALIKVGFLISVVFLGVRVGGDVGHYALNKWNSSTTPSA